MDPTQFQAFGVCRLPVIPVRAAPSEPSEMITQLIFGEHYGVLEVSSNGKWVRIQNHFDQYEGWIDLLQHHPIEASYYQEISQSDHLITCDLTAPLILGARRLNLIMGSILPQSGQELFSNQSIDYQGESKPQSQRFKWAKLKEIGLRYLEAPYLWGGKSPWGIDCSGLVQQVFRIAGYPLPRDARQQVLRGEEVHWEQAKAGDLAFFVSQDNKVNHVGIILEDHQILHASGKVRIDNLTRKGINRHQTISHQLYAIRRVMP